MSNLIKPLCTLPLATAPAMRIGAPNHDLVGTNDLLIQQEQNTLTQSSKVNALNRSAKRFATSTTPRKYQVIKSSRDQSLLEVFDGTRYHLLKKDGQERRKLDFTSFDPGLKEYEPIWWNLAQIDRDVSLPSYFEEATVTFSNAVVKNGHGPLDYRRYYVDYRGITIPIEIAERDAAKSLEAVRSVHKILSTIPGILLENANTVTLLPNSVSLIFSDGQACFLHGRIFLLHPETIRSNFPNYNVQDALKEAIYHELAHGFSHIDFSPFLFAVREYTRQAIKDDGSHGPDEYAKTSLGEALSVGFQNFWDSKQNMQQFILNLMLNSNWDPDEINEKARQA